MYETSNLSPPNSCSPLNNDTLKQSSLTNLLTNHHLNSINSVCFNMSTTLSPTSSNSSCSATAISPSAYYNNSYLPFNSSAVVNDSARSSAASSYFNETAAGDQQQPHQLAGHLPANQITNQYLENYSNSLISNHHNSPSLASSSPSSVSTFTNLHNHFGAHASTVNGATAGGAHHPLSAAHSLHHTNHLSASHPTQPDLTNHSSLSNSISNSLSSSSVMHHLNNQNSSFTFNHPHQANHQINLSSFNHLHHHHSNHNLDAADLAGGSSLAAPNPMSFYINNGDTMLNNTNSLTSLTNLTGLNANANAINNNANPLAWNTNIDYFGKTMDTFINSTNKFNKTIERGECLSRLIGN